MGREPCDAQQRPYFRPAAAVTRGQLAKIAANAAGYTETIPAAQQTFADVRPTDSFWVYTERIVLHDVISGYPCGGPGEPCDPAGRPYYRPAAGVIAAKRRRSSPTPSHPTATCRAPGSRILVP